jgi:3-isopropylmalate/(R)-2-methylmalate dehydratase small subunit
MKTIAEGTAYLFGNNIDTDQIYPGKYVELTEMEDIRKHAMSGSEEPDLATFFQPGDIIVAGTNFGCGSSREHAAMTLKGIEVGAILAENPLAASSIATPSTWAYPPSPAKESMPL